MIMMVVKIAKVKWKTSSWVKIEEKKTIKGTRTSVKLTGLVMMMQTCNVEQKC